MVRLPMSTLAPFSHESLHRDAGEKGGVARRLIDTKDTDSAIARAKVRGVKVRVILDKACERRPDSAGTSTLLCALGAPPRAVSS